MTGGFTVGKYRGEGRERWAVLGPTNVWYFPKRYGRRAAHALCLRLNREAR